MYIYVVLQAAGLKFLTILLVLALLSLSSKADITTTTSTTTESTSTSTKLPKVQITRTALHVARSLDPESTETVQVRTRTGDIATLIVRKRGGKSNLAVPFPVSISSSPVHVDDEREGKSNVPPPVLVRTSTYYSQDEKTGRAVKDVINIIEAPKNLSPPSDNPESNIKRGEKSVRVPSPVYVSSSPMSVKGEQKEPNNFWNRARSVMHIDSDGIPVIEGVRMPDDESDRQTWRNARVINGILVPYDNSSRKEEVPSPPHVPHEEPQPTKTYEEGFNPFNPSQQVELIQKKKHGYDLSHPSDTDARILEYINAVNLRESERRKKSQSRSNIIQFPTSRRSDDEEDTIQGRSLKESESEGRVLQYPGSPSYPTSLLYTPPSQKMSRVSFEGVRTPVLQYAHPELGVQSARVLSKQDEEEKVEIDQEGSQISGSTKGNTLSLAYFAQDIHSDRSPYAYEPGLDANEEQAEASGKETNSHDKRSSNNDPSTENSHHWPKKSFAYLHQQPSEDTYGLGNDKYIKRFPYNGYNHVHSGPNKDYINRYKNMVGGSEFSRYPHGGHYSFKTQTYQERPFWERIGDTIRDHVQTSMEKVTDITRPVVEPLVEATQKISHNLGFSSEGSNRHVIQDKVGSTVAAYPVLLPALGLVAGGAALGLGAVAVGRYLDVDMMKRRVGDISDDLEVEHKRALEKIIQSLGNKNLPQEEGTWVIAEEFKNPVEQKRILDNAARSLNEGRQLSSQDDAQRKNVEEIVRTLQDRYNKQQRDDGLKIGENIFDTDKSNPSIHLKTWELSKNYSPSQDDKVENTFGRQTIWSRADDIQIQDEQTKKVIETIVKTLADGDRYGQGERSFIKSEYYPENGSQQEKDSSALKIENAVVNEKEIESKRSSDEGVIFLVEEEPKSQLRKRIIFPNVDIRKIYLRREDDLNQDADPIHLDRIRRHFDSTNVQPQLTLTRIFGEETSKEQEPTYKLHHILSKRSTEEDEIRRLDRNKEYLENVLYTLKSGQQEILANIDELEAHHPSDWSNTPCAKKIFCDAMVKQPIDAVLLMEKKMATFLSL